RAVDARHAEAHALAGEIVSRALVELGRQVRSTGELSFNPSPFERNGVPALGWSLEPFEADETGRVELRSDGEWLTAAGVRLRLIDEPDAGDLYNFCPQPGTAPIGPESISLDGSCAVLAFGSDLSVRLSVDDRLRVKGVVHNDRSDHRLRL